MKTITTMTGKALVCVFLVAALAGCGGTKILKEPKPMVLEYPLVAGSVVARWLSQEVLRLPLA